jgi:hypothetical protein
MDIHAAEPAAVSAAIRWQSAKSSRPPDRDRHDPARLHLLDRLQSIGLRRKIIRQRAVGGLHISTSATFAPASASFSAIPDRYPAPPRHNRILALQLHFFFTFQRSRCSIP